MGAWQLPGVRPVRSPVAATAIGGELDDRGRSGRTHKHSLTAAAVDEAGGLLDELTVACPDGPVLAWAVRLGGERLWAVEDCRHVTRALERRLLAEGEELVRVAPKLTGATRMAGRQRGKSDPIDALAVARVALREPDRPSVCPRARSTGRSGSTGSAAGSPVEAPRCPGARRPRSCQPLPLADPRDRRARPRARDDERTDGAGPARAARLRRRHRGEAARRDRTDRTLPHRRTTRPPRRRRTTASKLRPHTTPPARLVRSSKLACIPRSSSRLWVRARGLRFVRQLEGTIHHGRHDRGASMTVRCSRSTETFGSPHSLSECGITFPVSPQDEFGA